MLLLLPLATATVVTVGPVLVALVGQEIVKKVVEAQKWLEKINGTGALQGCSAAGDSSSDLGPISEV